MRNNRPHLRFGLIHIKQQNIKEALQFIVGISTNYEFDGSGCDSGNDGPQEL